MHFSHSITVDETSDTMDVTIYNISALGHEYFQRKDEKSCVGPGPLNLSLMARVPAMMEHFAPVNINNETYGVCPTFGCLGDGPFFFLSNSAHDDSHLHFVPDEDVLSGREFFNVLEELATECEKALRVKYEELDIDEELELEDESMASQFLPIWARNMVQKVICLDPIGTLLLAKCRDHPPRMKMSTWHPFVPESMTFRCQFSSAGADLIKSLKEEEHSCYVRLMERYKDEMVMKKKCCDDPFCTLQLALSLGDDAQRSYPNDRLMKLSLNASRCVTNSFAKDYASEVADGIERSCGVGDQSARVKIYTDVLKDLDGEVAFEMLLMLQGMRRNNLMESYGCEWGGVFCFA